ncbi:MAG: hypothetical protein FD170_3857 [Bacteroidetes bacterium]|nr:MAG: hypothetical protein FD170_3857 [Bacteroidota bacterium]
MKSLYAIILPFCLLISTVEAQNLRKDTFQASGIVKTTAAASSTSGDLRETVCDTVRYPMPGEITYYFLFPPEVGYVTGNNSYKDKVKAEYFSTFETGSTITGIIADFAIARSNSNPNITFGIWDNTGANGKPGTLVASATKPLASIVTDVQNEQITTVTLSEPWSVTGPYYIGVVLPTTLGDTVALWCRLHVPGYNGTAWDQWEDGTWHAFSDPDNWTNNMLTSMLIHPIVCKTIGINELTDPETSISPNPATGVINIRTWKSESMISLEVYSVKGAKVYSRSYPGSVTNYNIDLGNLPKGVYFIRLSDGKRQHSQKLMLN